MQNLHPVCGLALAAVLLLGGGPLVAQAPDAGSLEVGILDVLLEQGVIDRDKYEELLALARAGMDSARSEIDLIEGRLERLRAPEPLVKGGRPGRLQFESADGKWSLNIKGRIQARAERQTSEDSSKDGNNLSAARVRLGFEGKAGLENVKYKIELDAPTEKGFKDPASAPDTVIRHAFVDWGFESGAGLIFGQTKFPFGREALTSSGSISFAERSLASREFAPEYEPLAMLHGSFGEGELEYYLAVSNGEGRGKNNTPGKDSNGMRHGARVVWNPYGPVKPDGPAFQTVKDGSTRVAIGASWMSNEDSSGLATVTPMADTDTLGLELQILSGPFSLLFERFCRSSDLSGAADVDDDGHALQLGCLLDEEARWELVARCSRVDYDAKDDVHQLGAGVNWYVDGHSGKWMLSYDTFDARGATPDSELLSLQYQAIF